MANTPEIVTPWSEVQKKDIATGLTIGFRDLDELDRFAETVSDGIWTLLNYSFYKVSIKGGPLSQTLKNQRPDRYPLASLKDLRVIIRPKEIGFIKNLHNLDVTTCVTLQAEADAYSSGIREKVATLQRLCTLGVRMLKEGRGEERPRVILTSVIKKRWFEEIPTQELSDSEIRIWQSIVRAD